MEMLGSEGACANQYWFCRADDLIPEESETVLLALKRLSQKEAYDRVFRIRRAVQVRNGAAVLLEIQWLIDIRSSPLLTSFYLKLSRPSLKK